MRKVSLSMLVLSVLVLVFAITLSVQAGPPETASGRWHYNFLYDKSVKGAGCNTFYDSVEEGDWSGTFNGDSIDEGLFVEHCSGSLSFNAKVYIDDATVEGKKGSLEISVVGRWPSGADRWTGTWVIANGSGELKHLRGQGTWWGSGDPDPNHPLNWGYVDYVGSYHFSPN
jgi:hypothetical protein